MTQSVKQVLYDLGVDLHTQDIWGITPAMEAACNGHVESLKWLHEMKADLNVRDKYGRMVLHGGERTVIHDAAANGHTEMLKVMSGQSNLE